MRPLAYVRDLLGGRHCGCDTCPFAGAVTTRKLMLFGSPNVGKSVLFNQLTGAYAIVSNYPGTTVEVTRGQVRIGDVMLDVVDTPGTYSLAPLSEDEQVAQDLLLGERPELVLHVVEARNLPRMLALTLQLIEAGRPLALVINIIDEAERAGLQVDLASLSRELGLPVVATAASTGRGLDRLRALVSSPPTVAPPSHLTYPEPIERALADLAPRLHADYGISPRAVALLLLQEDAAMRRRVAEEEPEAALESGEIVARLKTQLPQAIAVPIAVTRQTEAARIAALTLTEDAGGLREHPTEVLGRLAMHPLYGLPILLAVLYFGLYLGVGKLGAGLLVDLLDKNLFGQHLNPAAEHLVARLLPWPVVAKLFVGDYGLITLGLRYAFGIVLPLVGTFFLMFAVLEDSGYLPRLAMLVDRTFKRIGLSGRAIIPLVLGLGCDTMATLVTRVLETRRERVIATFLLALAIPCSAQLGVILGLLSTHPAGLAIWVGVVTGVFLFSGFLAAKILPGGADTRFSIEIPPLRLPSFRNVLQKTWNRMRWYALEVIPLFLLASVILWIGDLTRLFQLVVAGLRPVVHLLGLPDRAADAFLFGFFRRDYGAARLFDVHSGGAIAGVPLVVAMVTITLFVPCLAQFMVMQKERGWRTALGATAIIVPFAFGVGYVLNLILVGLRVQV